MSEVLLLALLLSALLLGFYRLGRRHGLRDSQAVIEIVAREWVRAMRDG